MSDNEPWLTSVDELMRIFRDALVALLPSLSRARISWHSPDAYADWDAIARTLFEQIVVNSIRWGVHDHEMEVPRYDLSYEDLSRFSVIAVSEPGDEKPLVFRNFDADDDTFAMARCFKLGEAAPLLVPVAKATFRFLHRQPDGTLLAISDLAVTL